MWQCDIYYIELSRLIRFVEALKDFESALSTLRGNLLIDYKQLGLQYKFYSCEVRSQGGRKEGRGERGRGVV